MLATILLEVSEEFIELGKGRHIVWITDFLRPIMLELSPILQLGLLGPTVLDLLGPTVPHANRNRSCSQQTHNQE